MKCKCSLNNNYEVIGLCDINKFNERIKDFQDKSWTQITIPEKLKLPSNKPPIKNITKVFFNIKLTSNKIIKTPSSEIPNIEGLKLTGKLLLVAGTMCQNIIYVSDTIRNSIHSVKFDVPFNTYIVVDKESNLEKDSFCVYPCVEDVFLAPLNERTISKSVTLFLFAHRIAAPVPEIEKLPNAYIFKTFNNEEMAKIEFDATNKKLIVTSTGKHYKPNVPFDLSNNNAVAFRFTLKDSTTAQDKVSASINENENADAFRDTLNEFNYEDNDKITVFSKDASKLILTNFPDKSENYDVPNGSDQNFEITQGSITPPVLPYKITVKSINNEEVLSIQFNKENLKFIVSSTGIVPDPSSNDAYFTLIFKNGSGIKLLEGTLNSNEDGSNFKATINNKAFSLAPGKLILIYKDKSKIEISNYPNDGDIYLPNLDINMFSIENNVLNDKLLPNMIKILGDNNEEVASIALSKGEPSISVVLSTGAIGTNTLLGNIPYVEFLNYQGSGYGIFAQILGKKDASDFALKFNRNISSAGPVRLFNKIPNRIIITNYKNQGKYRIGEEPEFFQSDGNALVTHNLNYNKIRLKNRDNSSVLYIYFDKLGSSDIYIEPYSTGKVNRDTDSFTFKIIDSSGIVKNNIQGNVNKGETADNIYISQFQNAPNISQRFNFGDFLTLEYSDKSLVEIFNFPFTQNPYNPIGVSSQKFLIAQDGLKLTTLSANVITFKGLNNNLIATVKFNVSQKQLIVESTGTTAHNNFQNQEYFAFVVKDANGNVKDQASVQGQENADNFKNTLNNKNFEYGDIIVIRHKEEERTTISNFLGFDNTINPFIGEDSFKITENGLESSDNYLPNVVIFRGSANIIASMVRFDKDLKTLSVGSSGQIAHHSFPNQEYFAFVLKGANGNVKVEASVKGLENADNFKNSLNNQRFEYGDIIVIRHKEAQRATISNFLKVDNTINSFMGEDSFRITGNGLEYQYNYLPNIITFKGYGNFEISMIRFNKDLKILSLGSTGKEAHYAFGTQEYFAFVLKDSTGVIKEEVSVKGNENADAFRDALNSKSFDFGYFITLRYKERSRVSISNFPNSGDILNPPNMTKDFKITENGFEDATAPTPPVSS